MTPVEEIQAATNRCITTLAVALKPITPLIDADPKGLDAVTMSAVLRAYADVIEFNFGEGNEMGPLKTAVDSIRTRVLAAFMEVR